MQVTDNYTTISPLNQTIFTLTVAERMREVLIAAVCAMPDAVAHVRRIHALPVCALVAGSDVGRDACVHCTIVDATSSWTSAVSL